MLPADGGDSKVYWRALASRAGGVMSWNRDEDLVM